MGLHTESITGRTEILGILADPVSPIHSPALVNAALAERRLFGKYLAVPMHVSSAHLATFLASLRNLQNFRGAVVMTPHKRTILEHLDHVSPEAEQAGACNVIARNARGYLSGSVCDGDGFVLGLQESGYGVLGARCLLVGTGGAGTTIAFALARNEVESIHVMSRTPPRAEDLARRVERVYPGVSLSTGAVDGRDFDLVINVTSLGLHPNDPLPVDVAVVTEHTIVCDIVIGSEPTPLLRYALSLGCPTYTGHEMLAAEVDLLIDYMTGENPPIALSQRVEPKPESARSH